MDRPLSTSSLCIGHSQSDNRQDTKQIAIVGISCRFPGDCTDPEKFGNLLSKGRSAWSPVPRERFQQEAFYHPKDDISGAFNAKGGHFLSEDVTLFDAPFFNISPTEAKAMDPQQRLQLELTYEALENAGIPLERLAGSNTVVFCGLFNPDYDRIYARDPDNLPTYAATGTGIAILANRLSYFFDLKGPSVTLDTGCSASLVALHLACQSILSGESHQAIVGGANIILDPQMMVSMSNLKFFSDEGRCYAFDDRGSGYGRGEGVACVVIKSLEDALTAGDPIRAIIRSSAVNQDGRTAGLTTPNQSAQENMIRTAYDRAGLSPMDTNYVEAHGTGTPAGDPVEAAALSAVFGCSKHSSRPILVGSVKTNIGHLEAASGLAGLLKAVLTLEKGLIPPSINFERVNQTIVSKQSKVEIVQYLQPFPEGVRRISVNSFGYGGTNAHLVLDSADGYLNSRQAVNGYHESEDSGNATHIATIPSCDTRPLAKLLIVSSKSAKSTNSMVLRLRNYLTQRKNNVRENFIDKLAYTLASRRSLMTYRMAFTASSIPELLDQISQSVPEPIQALSDRKLILVFTGQGAQWPTMGCELMKAYPVFERAMLKATKAIEDLGAAWNLLDELLKRPEESQVYSAGIGQPLCTAIQLALVDLLISWQIRPTAVVGHSSGEIAAAYSGGALDFASAIKVAYTRGALAETIITQKPELRGAMLAAALSESEALEYIAKVPDAKGKVVVACINNPSSVTISGDRPAILALQSALEVRKIFARRLKVGIAYHSHHMQCIADEYERALEGIKPSDSKSPEFFSSVSGGILSTESLVGSYWAKNMLSPVRFSDSIKEIYDHLKVRERDVFLEVGPRTALSGPLKQIVGEHLPQMKKFSYVGSLARDKDSISSMHGLASELFNMGIPINIDAVNFSMTDSRPRILVDLPTYPWDHTTKYWHESRISLGYRARTHPRHDLLGVLSSNSNPLEPTWSNRVNIAEVPWLCGHVIQSSMVYPAAGYIAMAIEACHQQYEKNQPGVRISRYDFRDITIGKALLVPDTVDGLETVFSLHPNNHTSQGSSYTSNDFRVFSYTFESGWTEHCRGKVIVRYAKITLDKVDGDRERLEEASALRKDFHDADVLCQRKQEPSDFYSKLNELGLQYQQLFRSVAGVSARPWEALGRVVIPDSVAMMPGAFAQRHILHPSTLDSCLQLSLAALIEAGVLHDTVAPTSIEKLSVSSQIGNRPGKELRVHAKAKPSGLRGFVANISAIKANGDFAPVIEISGLRCTALPGGRPQESSLRPIRLCQRLVWAPDVECMDGKDLLTLCHNTICSNEDLTQIISDTHLAASYFIRNALNDFGGNELPAKPHHQKLYQWMKVQDSTVKDGFHLPELAKSHLIERVRSGSTFGSLLCRIGQNLSRILKDKADPLSLMMNDGLVLRRYAEDEGLKRNYAHMAQYVDLMAHKKPDLNIIEIGGGSGSAASVILEKLSSGTERRFNHYSFTDISPAYFEKAELLLKPWADSVSFKALDIEKALPEQGFAEGQYDLVIASMVLHATSSIANTLKHVRMLLRPGGKLLLIEATSQDLPESLIFGTLPGWWLVEIVLSSKSPAIREEMMANAISTEIHAQSLAIRNLDDLITAEGNLICLFEVTAPLLRRCDSPTFEKIRNLLTTFARGILWVTRKGRNDSTSPEGALITGLARVARLDNPQIHLVTLDLDPDLDIMHPHNLGAIQRIYSLHFTSNAGEPSREFEYSVREGQIHIPRFTQDAPSNRIIGLRTRANQMEPVDESFFQADRPLKLDIGSPGMLDSLRFVDDTTAALPVAADEIRIELRAAGINFRDIMIAMGQLETSSRMAGECSGVVTEVGAEMKPIFKVGDRVCGWGQEAYASSIKLKGSAAKHIPDDMEFGTAASIPIVWTTVYYGLIHLARLEKGESVLIHSAAGGVGQAAIMLAQYLDADIFVTVGTEEKKAFLKETYHIPNERIFSSRQLDFSRAILELTSNCGVDVVLNSLLGEFVRASCDCLAPLGRFIEIGKCDILAKNSLDMTVFDRNVVFASVDLTVVFERNIKMGSSLLDRVFELIREGSISAIRPITVMPLTDIEPAFRLLQAGKHMGKIVLSAENEPKVKVMPRVASPPRFREDASYVLAGGLGGLGRAICHWMIDLGAKYIIVLSRSGIEQEAFSDFRASLGSRGTTLIGPHCDVSDADQLQTVLRRVLPGVPPVRGVIQAAMVLKDSSLASMSHHDYHDVIRPKVDGTMNLHEILSQEPLEFFISLSSCAGLSGSLGQANYAAASTFQDAFAHWRSNRGLMTRTLDLGAVKGAGYVHDNVEVMRSLVSRGASVVDIDDVLAFLGYAISTPISDAAPCQLAIGLAPDDWDKSGIQFSDIKFSHLRSQGNAQSRNSITSGGSSDLKQKLTDITSLDDACRIVREALLARISKLLAIPQDTISSEQTVSVYGADSLVSVELRNWFVHQLGTEVSVLEVLSSMSISELATVAVKRSSQLDPALLT